MSSDRIPIPKHQQSFPPLSQQNNDKANLRVKSLTWSGEARAYRKAKNIKAKSRGDKHYRYTGVLKVNSEDGKVDKLQVTGEANVSVALFTFGSQSKEKKTISI